ncbi:MAG: glycosyltransferase, partial [Fusobacteriaceae bacterium]|nr:glycosyltransferase [Fusobacteriaceae bacterium]
MNKSNKKNIVIKNGSLKMGGGERVLVDVLQNIDTTKYKLILLIDDDNGNDNIFLTDIPECVDVYFLRPQSLVKKIDYYYKKRKRNIFDKIFYNYYLWKNIKTSEIRTLEILKKLFDKGNNIDVFVDFSGGARKYIDKIAANKKIIWRHISISEYKTKSKLERYGNYANRYDILVSICESMKKEIEESLQFLKHKIKTIYNPIDFDRIINMSNQIDGLTIEEEALINKEYILTVSRLDNGQKDFDTLINSYKNAYEKGFDKNLYIIGDGSDREYIEKLISNNNLGEKVKILGIQKNPYVWMKYSDFFILSSREEGFPTVLLEAMALGKAVISTNCPTGPNEILKNGACGILIPMEDVDEMSGAMLKLIRDEK